MLFPKPARRAITAAMALEFAGAVLALTIWPPALVIGTVSALACAGLMLRRWNGGE